MLNVGEVLPCVIISRPVEQVYENSIPNRQTLTDTHQSEYTRI